MKIKFTVNGKKVVVDCEPSKTLLKVLREDLFLTGTKEGCGKGECGACTVIMDAMAVNSCIIPIGQVAGKSLNTIEGLSKSGELHPLQKAFIEEGAVQCGFCIPGMILSAKALLDINKNPSTNDIKVALSGNLCRCTGYTKIIEAVKKSAIMMRAQR